MLNEDEMNKYLLESPNPFSGTIIRSAWDESPDVESINKSLTVQVLENLRDIQTNNYTKMMLVLGQPGIGKTHFISRLRRYAEENNYLFVAVKPISSTTTIFSHIYREIFTSLRRKGSQDFTPMESLISHILTSSLIKALKEKRKEKYLYPKISEFINRLERDPHIIIHSIQRELNTMKAIQPLTEIAINVIEKEYPDVEKALLKILFKTLDKDLYSEAMRWLQGDDLDDDILEKLGISDSISDEQFAQRILHSIMTLSDRPLLLCFDQLESIYDRFHDVNSLITFFDVLVSLCNETPNALILLMVQAVIWDKIRPEIQESAHDRIEDIEAIQSPTKNETIELITKRLNKIWGLFPYPPEIKTYPFSENFINQMTDDLGTNPRKVLRFLSKKLNSLKLENKIQLLENYDFQISTDVVIKEVNINLFLDNQFNSIVSSYKETIEDRPYLTRESYLEAGLLDYFQGIVENRSKIGNFNISNVKFKQNQKDIDFLLKISKTEGKTENWGVEVCNNERGVSFNNLLKKIQNHLHKNLIQRWIIIRDSNLQIKKTWKKSIKLYESMKPTGDLCFIEVEDDARIYASKELLDSSSAGDLDVEGKIVSRKDVISYLLETTLPQLTIINKLFDNLKEPPVDKKLSKKEKKFDKTAVKLEILNKLEINSIMNLKRVFKDYDSKIDLYENILEDLVKENQVFVVIKDTKQIVISKKDERVF